MTKLKDLHLSLHSVKFDAERWKANEINIPPGWGKYVLADFLCKFNLIGMTQNQVEELIGAACKGRLAEALNTEPSCHLYSFQSIYVQIQFENEVVSRYRVMSPAHDRSTGQIRSGASKWVTDQVSE